MTLAALHAGEREEVLRCCTQRMPLAPDVQLAAVAAQLRGYVSADVAAVASEAALACAVQAVHAAETEGRLADVELPEFLAGLRVTAAHFEVAAAALGPAVLRGMAPDVPDVSFDDIGGLEVSSQWGVVHKSVVDRHGPLWAALGCSELPCPSFLGACLLPGPACTCSPTPAAPTLPPSGRRPRQRCMTW